MRDTTLARVRLLTILHMAGVSNEELGRQYDLSPKHISRLLCTPEARKERQAFLQEIASQIIALRASELAGRDSGGNDYIAAFVRMVELKGGKMRRKDYNT